MNNPFGLEGRRILVTGGTRGIGRAISLQLARAGAAVVANHVRDDEAAQVLRRLADEEGLAIEIVRADLTSPKGLAALHEQMSDAGDALVSLVHCAATGVHRPIAELTPRHWDWTMALNVRAFFELVRQMLPLLREGSTIVPVSSAGAVRAVPSYAAIGASKAALEAFARHLACELAPRGIRVNVLAPGSVETDAWAAFPDKENRFAEVLRRTPTGRTVTLEEIAQAAHFLCSTAAAGLVGHTLVVDGGARVVE